MLPRCFIIILLFSISYNLWSQYTDIHDSIYISKGLNTQYNLLPIPNKVSKYKYITIKDRQDSTYAISYCDHSDNTLFSIDLNEHAYIDLKEQLSIIEDKDPIALSPSYYRYGKGKLISSGFLEGLISGYYLHSLNSRFNRSSTDQLIQGRVAGFSTLTYSSLQGISSIIVAINDYVRPPMTNMQVAGWITGFTHGFQVSGFFSSADYDSNLFYVPPWRLHFGAFTALSESWLNYYIAKKHNYTTLESNLFIAGGITGNLLGYHIGRILFPNRWTNVPVIMGLAGYVGGAVIGSKAKSWSERTAGDLKTVLYSTLVGTVSGYAFSNLTNRTSWLSAYAAFGTAAGLTTGILITRNTRLTSKVEKNLLLYGGLGTSVGLLTSFVFSSLNSDPTILPVIIPTTILGLCYGHFKNTKRLTSQPKQNNIGFRYSINPVGIAGLFSNENMSPQLAMFTPPIFQATMSF